MDNTSFLVPQPPGNRAIEADEFERKFLSAYSQNLNPIASAFAKLKAVICGRHGVLLSRLVNGKREQDILSEPAQGIMPVVRASYPGKGTVIPNAPLASNCSYSARHVSVTANTTVPIWALTEVSLIAAMLRRMRSDCSAKAVSAWQYSGREGRDRFLGREQRGLQAVRSSRNTIGPGLLLCDITDKEATEDADEGTKHGKLSRGEQSNQCIH